MKHARATAEKPFKPFMVNDSSGDERAAEIILDEVACNWTIPTPTARKNRASH